MAYKKDIKNNIKRMTAVVLSIGMLMSYPLGFEEISMLTAADVQDETDTSAPFELCIETKKVVCGESDTVDILIYVGPDTAYEADVIGASIKYDSRLELVSERDDISDNEDDAVYGLTLYSKRYEANSKIKKLTFKVPDRAGEYEIYWYHPPAMSYCVYRKYGNVIEDIPYTLKSGKLIVTEPSSRPEPKAEGKCGSDAAWKLYPDGVLIIDGKDEMYDFLRESDMPWFDYRNDIKSAVIKEGITYIGSNVFSSCSALGSVSIAESVCDIGDGAFINCDMLNIVYIPENVSEIGENAFYDCDGIIAFRVAENNRSFSSYSGVLYDKDMTLLINYPAGKEDEKFSIPNTVAEIADNAFRNAKLVNVDIPFSVSKFGCKIFEGTPWIEAMRENDPLVTVNNTVIDGTEASGNVIIPASVKCITDSAFENSTSLSSVYIFDPECQIADSARTFPKKTVIYGYENSTASEYALIFGRKFISLGTPYVPATTPAVTTTESPMTTTEPTVTTTEPPMEATEPTMITTEPPMEATELTVITTEPPMEATEPTVITTEPPMEATEPSAAVTTTEPSAAVTTTVSTTSFAVTENKRSFTFGRDNWNFNNTVDYFSGKTYRDQINKKYLDKLESSLTNSEYQVIFQGYTNSSGEKTEAKLDTEWGGSCYGMSASALLAYNGFMRYDDYRPGAASLYGLDSPMKNEEICSLITYYQMLQFKDSIMQNKYRIKRKTAKQNIETIISEIDKYGTALVGFTKHTWGSHAVLAYGYEYQNWRFDNVSYDGCIYVYDPLCSMTENKEYNIYFDSNTYNWMIPAYRESKINSLNGAEFFFISGKAKDINAGGYLTAERENTAEKYIARLDTADISDDGVIKKVKKNSEGNYMMQGGAAGDIVADTVYSANGKGKGISGYNLMDSESGYQILQDTVHSIDTVIRYENCMLGGSSSSGREITFDRNGYVSVKGDASDFAMSMTFDGEHPTDWFALSVKGEDAENAELEKQENGYILKADRLSGVKVIANNRTDYAEVSFSTDNDEVYIYEINEHTIGINIDTDGDGSYETRIARSRICGDVNDDGTVSASDMMTLIKYLLDTDNAIDEYIADVNEDGKVDVMDLYQLKIMFLTGV